MSKTMAIPPKNNNHSLVFGTHYAVGGRANLEDRVAARHIQTAGGLPLTVAMVADGMGGHNAGEVAAQLTVNTVYEALENSPIATPQQIPEALAQALAYANQVVYEAARTDENKRGMGTTATVAAVHNGRLYLAHVGDSRAYLVRNGRARQITQDHTWGREMLRRGVLSTQEIAKHPKANELYSSIGYETAVHVDLGLYLEGDAPEADAQKHQGEPLQPQDRLLLCSDGLVAQQQNGTKPYVSDLEIVHILERHDPDNAAKLLVKKALSRAADDNVGAVVLELPDSKHKSTFLPRFIRTLFVLLLVAMVGVGLFLFLTQPTLFGLTPPAQPDSVIATAIPGTPTATPSSVPVDSETETLAFQIQANQEPFTEQQHGLPFTVKSETGQTVLLYEPLNFTIFLTAGTQIELVALAGTNLETNTEIRIEKGLIVIDNEGTQPIIVSQDGGIHAVTIYPKAITAVSLNSSPNYKFQVDCLGVISGDGCYLEAQVIQQGTSLCAGGEPFCENKNHETPGAINYAQFLQISTRIPTPTATPTVTPSPTFTPTPLPTATRRPTVTPAVTAESPALLLDSLFVESVRNVQIVIAQAGGLLDQLGTGQDDFQCELFKNYYEAVQSNRDTTYDVPEEWVKSYNNALDTFLQSNFDLYGTCEAGQVVTNESLSYQRARTGINESLDKLNQIIDALNLE